MPQDLDMAELGIFLVEGTVEVDPLSDRVTVRTFDSQNNPVDFDPISALTQFKGSEVRVIIAPLASITQLEELAATSDSEDFVIVVDPPPAIKG